VSTRSSRIVAAFMLALAPACTSSPAALTAPTVEIPAAAPPAGEASRSPALAAPQEDRNWYHAESEAVALARREHRPMIVYFTAEWCGACKELQRETYANPRFIAASHRFVKAKIDCTDDEDPGAEAIKARYHVIGLPTIIVLDANGNEQARFTEFVGPDKLIDALAKIR
jgi:thiol:disulfide interchange protein DsbD